MPSVMLELILITFGLILMIPTHFKTMSLKNVVRDTHRGHFDGAGYKIRDGHVHDGANGSKPVCESRPTLSENSKLPKDQRPDISRSKPKEITQRSLETDLDAGQEMFELLYRRRSKRSGVTGWNAMKNKRYRSYQYGFPANANKYTFMPENVKYKLGSASKTPAEVGEPPHSFAL